MEAYKNTAQNGKFIKKKNKKGSLPKYCIKREAYC